MAKRSKKPIDYAALDSQGFEGLQPSSSPRAGSGGLPSPQGPTVKSEERLKREMDQYALMRQINEKLDRVQEENKRLEAMVKGTPPTRSRKQKKEKSSSRKTHKPIDSSIGLDDLRQMEELSRVADKALQQFGADISNESSQSNSSDDETDDEKGWRKTKTSGKKSNKLKSGKTARITTRVVNPQIWPHSELSLSYVSKDVGYDDLTIEEFVAGFTTIMSLPQTTALEGRARLQHLTRLMYLATQYEWSAVRDFHATVLLEIERGSLTWNDSFSHIEQQALIGRVKVRPLSSTTPKTNLDVKMSGVLFCRDFNKSKCQNHKDHYGVIKGVQKWVQHICAKCWTTNKKIERHSEYSTECPLFVAEVAGSSSPAKASHSG